MTITISDTEYEIRKLSTMQMMECIKNSKATYESLTVDNDNAELGSALAEYGALCSACLYIGDEPAFKTSNEVLACLSIDELCDVYDAYKTISNIPIENGCDEK